MHLGPQFLYPMKGDFIDLTQSPTAFNDHEGDKELIKDADKVLVDIDQLNNTATDIN